MKVKWNNQTIDIQNWLNKTTEFYCEWNYYSISIKREPLKTWSKNYGNAWYVQLITPNGGYDYDGYFKTKDGEYGKTLKGALQDCFDNISYPLIQIGEEDDE